MKTFHTLKEKTSILENKFFVFDTETRGLRAKSDAFIFGVVYGRNYEKVIHSVQDFKSEFLHERYHKKIVFAHNAEYDLNVIYDNIYLMDRKAIFNGRFIAANNGNCMFADSVNIYPASLEVIGNLMGFPKLKINEKFVRGDKNIKVTQEDIEYCKRDCHLIYKALSDIFNRVGNVKITLAGLSMDFFRRYYLENHIKYKPEFVDIFFNSYYGGRTEAFKIGDVTACVYDINSMYPYAMLNASFPNPTRLKYFKNNIEPEFFQRHFLKRYEGAAKIKLFHVEHYFGFLPYKKDGKLLFPVGEFEGWYNFNEIRFALKEDAIKILEVSEIVYGVKMESPFIKYVEVLYYERKETENELLKLQLKLLLNSLYGKFAQRKKYTMMYIEDIKNEYLTIDAYENSGDLSRIIPFSKDRDDCFLELRNKKMEKTYNSIALFSSYITSFSRIMLLENLLKYKNCNPVYCDTDSIFFEYDPKIKNSDELGQWKKEEKIVTNIRGLKNYSYFSSGKIFDKIKGVPKKSKKIGENKFEYENLVKTREAIRRQIEAGILVKREKEIKLKYDKRIVLKNNDTLPIQL